MNNNTENKAIALQMVHQAQGTLDTLHDMIEKDAAYADILLQLSSVQGVLKKGQSVLIKEYLDTVLSTSHGDDRDEIIEKILYLMSLSSS